MEKEQVLLCALKTNFHLLGESWEQASLPVLRMHTSEIFLFSPLGGGGKKSTVVSDTVVPQSLLPKTPRDLLGLNAIFSKH